ncbi:MAG: Lrp/AsnC family transcriptional regulator [Candidatus Diapherotrites archaeon]
MELDGTNREILNVITENARLSLRQIAKKTGFSPATVMKRMKSLEDGGAIKRYTVMLDYDKLGYEFGVITSIHISGGKSLELEKEVAKEVGVIGVYGITGADDLLVISRFNSRRAVDNFLKRVREFDFVEHSQSSLILRAAVEKPLQF